MSEEMKKYRVLKPVAISGIQPVGTVIELAVSVAESVGIGEYLEEITEEAPKAPEESSAKKDEEESGSGKEEKEEKEKEE